MSALLHLIKSATSGSLVFKCLQPSLDISGELCISSHCFSSPSSVQVSGRTCNRSIQTSNSCCTSLDGGLLALHSYQHVQQHYSLASHHKRLGVQWSAIQSFYPLVTWSMCSTDKVLLLCLAVAGVTSVGKKGLLAILERMGRVVCWRGYTKQCHIIPLISKFLVHLFGSDYCGVQLMFTYLWFQHFWNLIFMKRLQIILSSRN